MCSVVFDAIMAPRLALYRKAQTLDSYGNLSNVVYTELLRDKHGSGLTPRFFLNLSEVLILKKMNDI
jgi:hypothetical protein